MLLIVRKCFSCLVAFSFPVLLCLVFSPLPLLRLVSSRHSKKANTKLVRKGCCLFCLCVCRSRTTPIGSCCERGREKECALPEKRHRQRKTPEPRSRVVRLWPARVRRVRKLGRVEGSPALGRRGGEGSDSRGKVDQEPPRSAWWYRWFGEAVQIFPHRDCRDQEWFRWEFVLYNLWAS